MTARQPVQMPRPTSAAELVASLCAQGRIARAGLTALANGESAKPDAHVADLVHFLTLLHGEVPSLLDAVSTGTPELGALLSDATERLHADRRWLAHLSVAIGGHLDLGNLSEAEQAVRGIRDAMVTLAQSVRAGCGLGVALAFLAEWPELREAFDGAGTLAFSVKWPTPPSAWPDEEFQTVAQLAEAQFADQRTARAITFGASQFAEVHRQVFALADARATAR